MNTVLLVALVVMGVLAFLTWHTYQKVETRIDEVHDRINRMLELFEHSFRDDQKDDGIESTYAVTEPPRRSWLARWGIKKH